MMRNEPTAFRREGILAASRIASLSRPPELSFWNEALNGHSTSGIEKKQSEVLYVMSASQGKRSSKIGIGHS